MNNKHFKTIYLSYWESVRKDFLIPFLTLACFILFIFVYIRQDDFKSIMLTILVLGIIYGILGLYMARQFVNEVEFQDDILIVTGFNFNSQWRDELKISNSKIEIHSKRTGYTNVDYYLRIISKKKRLDINRSFNWDYSTLIDIFNEFKRIKEEKIILDEKYFLDIMEKRANGRSHWDIVFGKDTKK